MGPRVALLSNPRSTGNQAELPRIRAFCAEHPEIFHYEVERADQIGEALATIARVKPAVLVINGGDGTVQASLTALHGGAYFGDAPPPVAVLPNGKTNLIALDLGAKGDPVDALRRVLELTEDDLSPHLVARELIQLTEGGGNGRVVLGMFLGGAGLADTMLYCRNRIYPLGLPNAVCHVLAAIAWVLALVVGIRARFLPRQPEFVRIDVPGDRFEGRFAVLLVTTLDKLLLSARVGGAGGLKMLAIEHRTGPILRTIGDLLRGRLGEHRHEGVHVDGGNEIRIEGARSSVVLDGEVFEARAGRPIVLTPTRPMPFLRLAA